MFYNAITCIRNVDNTYRVISATLEHFHIVLNEAVVLVRNLLDIARHNAAEKHENRRQKADGSRRAVDKVHGQRRCSGPEQKV